MNEKLLERKQTNILMHPADHVRLKIQAAKMGCTIGAVIEQMLDTLYPVSPQEGINIRKNILLGEEESKC